MPLLDTHAWLWWASYRQREFSARAIDAIRDPQGISISAISCWEIAWLIERDRLRLGIPASQWIETATAAPGVTVLDVTQAIAVRAGSFSAKELHRDPADRFIVATAIEHGLPLITRDRAIRDAGVVETIW